MSCLKDRVLVVDDEPQVLVALEDLLSDDFTVLKTESGEEALRLMDREREIAVVISDQRMPRMSGADFLAKIAPDTESSRILLTGYADLSAVIRAVNEGRIFAYVMKPWSPEDLQLKVRTAAEHFRLVRELHQERQLLRDLMDNVPDGIYFKDPELRFQRANRAFAAMTASHDPTSIVGKRLEDVVPTLSDARDIEADERRVLSEARASIDTVREWSNGKRRWLSETKAPVRGWDGGIVGLVGISRDVTERVETQEALRKSEEMLRKQTRVLNSILDSMADGVIAVGQAGDVLLFNRRAQQILGVTPPEDLASDWLKTYGACHADRTTQITPDQDPLRRAMKGDAVSDVEIFVRDGKGGGAMVTMTASALRDDAGRLAGGIALLRDVTLQRSLEQQLVQSQKMDAIGRLAGGIAHDFNNLLAVILSYAELGIGGLPRDNPLREDLTQLIDAVHRASALTRQLLAFSRRQVVQTKLLKLNEIVSNIERMLKRVIGEDIELTTKLTPALGTIRADAGQVEQIILNLTVNARDAMPDGGRLTIATDNVSLRDAEAASMMGLTTTEFVVLTVADTGTGMPLETRRHIFEPFFTTKEVGKGTGLGLSTVYGIVQQIGGQIRVDSELSRGTSFEIFFPRTDGIETAPERTSQAPPSGKGAGTILLVEDDGAVRRVALRILREAGYAVLEANGVTDARRICDEMGSSIDLLLTDVVMPEINGPKLAEELSNACPGLRVLYMSGYPGGAIAQDQVLAQTEAYVEKPFSPASLVKKVRQALGEDSS